MAKKTHNVGRISVEMVADTVDYVQKLKAAKGEADKFEKGVKKPLGKSAGYLKDIGTAASLVQGPMGGVASRATALGTMFRGASSSMGGFLIGITGLAAGLSALSITMMHLATAHAKAQGEIRDFAASVGMSHEDILVYGRAAESAGISTEKFTDIVKDVKDKLGDFVREGSGPFKDVFNAIGDTIGYTAQELARMSGPDVLQAVVTGMERANMTMTEQTFLLESIGNDAVRLNGTFANGGAVIERYRKEFAEFNTVLSSGTINAFKDVDRMTTTLKTNLGNLVTEFMSPLADEWDSFLKSLNRGAKVNVEKLQKSNVAADPFEYIRRIDKSDTNQVEQLYNTMASAMGDLAQEAWAAGEALENAPARAKNAARENYSALVSQLTTLQNAYKELHDVRTKLLQDKYDKSLAEGKRLEAEQAASELAASKKAYDDMVKSHDKEIKEKERVLAASLALTEKYGVINEKAWRQDLENQKKETKEAWLANAMSYEAYTKTIAAIDAKIASGPTSEAATKKAEERLKAEEDAQRELSAMFSKYGLIDYEELKATKDKELALINAQYEKGKVSYSQYCEAMLAIEEAYENARKGGDGGGESDAEKAEKEFQERWADLKEKYGIENLETTGELLNQELSDLESAYAQKLLMEEEYQKAKAAMQAEIWYQEKLKEYQFFQDMSKGAEMGLNILNAVGAEQSAAAKTLFGIQQGIALANATMQAYGMYNTAFMAAEGQTTWGRIAAGLSASATGWANVAGIASTTLGQFHSGADSVASEGSYLLQKGERVVQPKANADLTSMLKDYNQGGGGKSVTISAPLTIQGNVTDEAWFQKNLVKHRAVIAAAQNKFNRERPNVKKRT